MGSHRDSDITLDPLLAKDDDFESASAAGSEDGSETDRESTTLDSAATPEPSTARLLAIMGSIWLCTFFAALDGTVVATLSGPISAEFNSGTAFSWIASAYLIANAACQPLSGKITDIYGRRAGLIYATSVFAIGTTICGSAGAAWVMILGRVIAGMGGGCLNTISSFVGSDLIPLRRRGLWQGIANIVYGAGMSIGGVYGGAVHSRFGWRFAFYAQVPFILFGGVCSSVMVKIPPKQSDRSKIRRVDFLGASVLVISLVSLLLALNSGGNIVPWSNPLVPLSLGFGILGLVIFVLVEKRIAKEPIIPIHLLLNRTVAAACAAYWFATMSVYTLLYYVPVYLQVVHSASTTQSGVLLIPQSAGMAIGSMASGFVMRATGSYWRWNVIVQFLFVTSAILVLLTFNANLPTAAPYAILLLSGTAYGAMLTVTFVSLIGAVEHEYQAVITSASYAFRSAGSSMGIAIGGAIYQNVLREQLVKRFGGQPGAADQISRIRKSLGELSHLPSDWHDGVIASYVEALHKVWWATVGTAVLAGAASLLMKEHVLHKTLKR